MPIPICTRGANGGEAHTTTVRKHLLQKHLRNCFGNGIGISLLNPSRNRHVIDDVASKIDDVSHRDIGWASARQRLAAPFTASLFSFDRLYR
jgi:hypothetical protein